ncbi:hypothetical protein Leryth_009677 [Lithospermum erythrorhizon]|nr:hypothetical protein Leryth_009677 [Lithospermum erythrorhizon]
MLAGRHGSIGSRIIIKVCIMKRKMYKMLDKRVDEDQFQEAIRHWEKPEVQVCVYYII